MGLILALDTPSLITARFVIGEVRELISHIKISHSALASFRAQDIDAIIANTPVFLDLKWFDIPNTVAMAIEAYSKRFSNLKYFTFHGVGSEAMIEVVTKYQLQALSVISLSSDEVNTEEFLKIAQRNYDLGVRGFICPAPFLQAMRNRFGNEITLITPGIRNTESNSNDHFFSSSSDNANKWGATHLVVGRPILESDDPYKITLSYL